MLYWRPLFPRGVNDTVECWIHNIVNVVRGQSRTLRAAQECVVDYYEEYYGVEDYVVEGELAYMTINRRIYSDQWSRINNHAGILVPKANAHDWQCQRFDSAISQMSSWSWSPSRGQRLTNDSASNVHKKGSPVLFPRDRSSTSLKLQIREEIGYYIGNNSMLSNGCFCGGQWPVYDRASRHFPNPFHRQCV